MECTESCCTNTVLKQEVDFEIEKDSVENSFDLSESEGFGSSSG
jgi:hypothetical protein